MTMMMPALTVSSHMLADTAFIDAGNCEYLERRAMCRKARAACTAATAAAAAAANARELVARGRREHTTGKHFSLQCWKGILWLIGGRAHEPKLYSPFAWLHGEGPLPRKSAAAFPKTQK